MRNCCISQLLFLTLPKFYWSSQKGADSLPFLLHTFSMEKLESHIRNFIEGILEETPELFIVEIKISNQQASYISIVLDGDNGIGIDQCVSVSRQLSAHLEEEDLIEGSYNLEVTSPGIDQPLQSNRQFNSRIGRKLELHLADENVVAGKLEEVTEEGLKIMQEIKEKGKKVKLEPLEVPFGSIQKAMVLVSFK